MADKNVQMPDGSVVAFPDSMSDDQISAVLKAQHPAAAQQPQEGFFRSLGDQLGVPNGPQAPIGERIKQAAEGAIMGPAGQLAKSLYEQGKQSFDQLRQANQARKEGNTAGVIQHAVTAVPIVGPALDKASDQYAEKNYTGEAGTLTGASAQAAPMILGAADAAGITRPNIPSPVSAVRNIVSPAARMQNAGELFKSVAKDANSVPVQLDTSGDAALRLMDWQKKTQLGPTINKYLNRITNPKLGPLTYEEGRQYYQLLGRLSADETSKLPPVVQRDLAQMVSGLKTDIGNSAGQVGQAANYYQAMGDYATAKRLQGWYDFAKKTLAPMAVKAAAGATGAGAAGALGYQIYKQAQQ